MKTNWQYNHIVDLEYFCHQESEIDRKELHLRDRNILLECQEQRAEHLDANKASRRELIWLWLTKRIQQDFQGPDQKSPGSIFLDAQLTAGSLATIIGILIGLTAGFSFFSYSGTTPINVFHFLLLFVVSQMVFICLVLGACLVRLLLPGLKLPSFYSLIFRGLLSRLVSFFHKQWLRTATAEKRLSINHAFGIFKARSSVYGSLFYWPLFALSQLFSIGFNLGLLAATLVKITTSDVAFGWQSTLQFSAEAIHRAVMFIALPWSWFTPTANSYPSIAEIEGSRIILKDGIYHLSTGDLIAWWPFLVFCLLFYGFLLRLTLFLGGKLMASIALQKQQFDTPACLAVIRRMQTPLVTTQAQPESIQASPADYAKKHKEPTPPTTLSPVAQVVLVPDDIYALCPAEKLSPLLQARGFNIAQLHRFMVGYDEDRQLKDQLKAKDWDEGEGILILMEGWMVPLVDFLSYLKELRQILPKNAIIQLVLVGRPKDTPLTEVTPEDFAIWQHKIEAIGDPYLTISPLIS